MRPHTARYPPLPSRGAFWRQLLRHLAFVSAVIGASLGLGAAGYHRFAGLPWLDSTLNAAMILTGMGPVNALTTPEAKLFGIAYALFSGVAFLTSIALLLAPAAHRLLHRFHLELYEPSDGDD